MKFRFLTAAALAALTVTGAVNAQEPTKGGDLVVAMSVTLSQLDAHANSGLATRTIAAHLYEGVVTRGETGEIIPQLAESFNASEDAKTYEFSIRHGVTFHDGSSLDAGDVIASFERMKEFGVDRSIMSKVDRFEKVDDYTVKVYMSEAQPTFLDSLSSPRVIVGIFPEEIAILPKEEFKPVGTGPFMFDEWVPDSHIKLVRFEEYAQQETGKIGDGFGGRRSAYVDSVTFRNVPEAGAQVAGLLTGDYHVADQVSAQDVPRLEATDGVSAVKVLPWYMVHQTFNLKLPPADDLKFRKAIQIGLDLGLMLDFATGGNFQLGHAWQYEGFPYYSEVGLDEYNIADVDRAKALLAESNYNGEEVVILTSADEAVLRDYGIALADQLNKIGINTRIVATDSASRSALISEKKEWNIVVGGFGFAPSIGPFGMLGHFSGKKNLQGFQDPVIENAVNRARTSLNVEERKQAFADYQGQVLGQAYSVRAGAAGIYLGVRDELNGYTPSRIVRAWNVWFDAG